MTIPHYSVDPASTNYSSWTPYHYVMNNPIKFVDPTGMFTELFDENGNKIGEDENGNDGNVSIITDKKEAKRIQSEYKDGGVATDVAKGVKTTKTALGEASNVLTRTEDNGGLREESSIVTGDGQIVRGETGTEPAIQNIAGTNVQTASTTLPSLPEGANSRDATAIHSHPTTVQVVGDQAFPQVATIPSFPADRTTFASYGTNIIVGNLNQPRVEKDASGKITVGSATKGAAIYKGNGSTPRVVLTQKAMNKIIR